MVYTSAKFTLRQGDARSIMNLAQVSRVFRDLIKKTKKASLLVRPFIILAKHGACWKKQCSPLKHLSWNIYIAGDHCEIRRVYSTLCELVD